MRSYPLSVFSSGQKTRCGNPIFMEQLPFKKERWSFGGAAAKASEILDGSVLRIAFSLHEEAQWTSAGYDGISLDMTEPKYVSLIMRGNATGPMSLEVKFIDGQENVYISRQDNISLSEEGVVIELEPADIRFGWGPVPGSVPGQVTRLEVAVAKHTNDSEGWIELEDFRCEDAPDGAWYLQSLGNHISRIRGLIGWENCETKVPVGRAGTIASDACRFMIDTWLYDHTSQHLITPESLDPQWSMEEDGVPVYHILFNQDGLGVEVTLFAEGTAEDRLHVYGRVAMTNHSDEPRQLSVLHVLRPNALRSDGCVESVAVSDRMVTVNGDHYLICSSMLADTFDAALDLESFGRLRFAGNGQPSICWNDTFSAQSCWLEIGETSHVEFGLFDEPADDVPFDAALLRVRDYWKTRSPLRLKLPDQRYQDMFYASANYQLMMMHKDMLCPGPRDYKHFFLHDATDMVNSLNMAGLLDVGRRALEYFVFGKHAHDKIYLDGIGGCIFARYEYYRYSKDLAYLKSQYDYMISLARDIEGMLQENRRDDLVGTPFYGLVPPSKSQDNWNYPVHLYVDNWWSLLGLKSAYDTALELGYDQDAAWLKTEYERYQKDLLSSFDRVCARDGTDWIPGFAEQWGPEMRVVDNEHRILGDTQMAWAHRPAFYPGISLGLEIPAKAFRSSYKKYWETAGKFSGYDGGWYVEYEKVFWGYNVKLAQPMMYLGMGDVTLSNIEWMFANQSAPMAWMEAMPSMEDEAGNRVVNQKGGIIGDVPHGWTAAHCIILIRNMLLREEEQNLHLLSCIPAGWLTRNQMISVKDAPTIFGDVSFEIRGASEKNKLHVKCNADALSGCQEIRLHLPNSLVVKGVEIDEMEPPPFTENEIILPAETITLLVRVDEK